MIKPKQKQLSQNQLTVVLVMLAVIVWVIGLIISRAVLGTILFNNKVISRKRSVESTLSANISKLSEIKRNFEALETKSLDPERVLRALPTKQDVPSLASKLEALMAASSVSFKSFGLENTTSLEDDPASPVLSEGLQEYTYSIKVEGAYAGIVQMLRNFEREISPMRLLSVKVQGTEQTASAELTIRAYFQSPFSLDFEKETLQ